jgi:hypothetical protein
MYMYKHQQYEVAAVNGHVCVRRCGGASGKQAQVTGLTTHIRHLESKKTWKAFRVSGDKRKLKNGRSLLPAGRSDLFFHSYQ